jgi:hypothetical protein
MRHEPAAHAVSYERQVLKPLGYWSCQECRRGVRALSVGSQARPADWPKLLDLTLRYPAARDELRAPRPNAACELDCELAAEKYERLSGKCGRDRRLLAEEARGSEKRATRDAERLQQTCS